MNIIRKTILPYCLHRMADGTYVILNRHYKPCGVVTEEHVNYDQYPRYNPKRMSEKIAASISFKGDAGIQVIFLYNDGCIPFKTTVEHTDQYIKRLTRIAQWECVGIYPD